MERWRIEKKIRLWIFPDFCQNTPQKSRLLNHLQLPTNHLNQLDFPFYLETAGQSGRANSAILTCLWWLITKWLLYDYSFSGSKVVAAAGQYSGLEGGKKFPFLRGSPDVTNAKVSWPSARGKKCPFWLIACEQKGEIANIEQRAGRQHRRWIIILVTQALDCQQLRQAADGLQLNPTLFVRF